jgi:hypothetical protein
MADPVTIKLAGAVTHDGKTYTSLTLRKMKAKDLVAGDLVTGEARRAFAIFASMASVPIQVVEELDIDDFERLGEAAAPLMGKSAAAAMANTPSAEAQ